jgi:hypothetical protein
MAGYAEGRLGCWSPTGGHAPVPLQLASLRDVPYLHSGQLDAIISEYFRPRAIRFNFLELGYCWDSRDS